MQNNKPFFSIILAGLPGSGKTTGAVYLKKFGWDIISAGDIIREMCCQEELPISRKFLQGFGIKFLHEKGFEYFADIMLYRCQNSDKVVFEGIRPIQVIYLIKNTLPKVLTIYIEANIDQRIKRLQTSENINFHELIEIDSNPLEREVLKIKPLADSIIYNDRSLNFFYNKLDKIVSSFLIS
ncbi:MAG: AAA family ATPase [Candidatus Omnitrophica bacterium]|nr:AAA family ATPase [Candidatus Omnitrophota bacterium]